MRTSAALIALLGGFVVLAGDVTAGPQASSPAAAGLPLQFLSAPIQLTIAGYPALLRVVRADAEPQLAIDAVAAVWHREHTMIRRDEDGPWRNLSRIDRHGIQALQLRRTPRGGSEGYLVSWRLASAALAASADSIVHRLLPPGATVLSDVANHSDAAGRTLVAWVSADTVEAARSLAGRATALELTEQRTGQRAAPDPGGARSLLLVGAGKELAVTLHPEGRGTAIVIHLMETRR